MGTSTQTISALLQLFYDGMVMETRIRLRTQLNRVGMYHSKFFLQHCISSLFEFYCSKILLEIRIRLIGLQLSRVRYVYNSILSLTSITSTQTISTIVFGSLFVFYGGRILGSELGPKGAAARYILVYTLNCHQLILCQHKLYQHCFRSLFVFYGAEFCWK